MNGIGLHSSFTIRVICYAVSKPHTGFVSSHSDDVTPCVAARIVDGRHREAVQRVRHEVKRRQRDVM